jgi:uncharacterized membrane protein
MPKPWPELSIKWKQLKMITANLHKHLHYVYLAYAIITILLSATITPGFQVPDERAHFLRAEQVSRGIFVATFILQQTNREHRTSPDKRIIYPDSGGYIGNPGINYSAFTYEEVTSHPEKKVSYSLIKSSKKFYWNSGLAVVNFPNTGFYPPMGYLFPAIGILFGKLMHMSIFNTLILSRIINGIGCAVICFIALGLANRCRFLLFFVLLLPLTISLFASASQDAMLISLSALMLSQIDHIESVEKRIYTKANLVLLLICITAIAAARPPYFLLIFVFLFLKLTPKMKVYSIAIPFILICIWGLVNAHNYGVAFAPPEMNVNAKFQMAYVMGHPFKFIGFFFHWDFPEIINKIREFIGVLGWLDLVLPGYYYKLAFFVFFLTFLTIINFSTEKLKLRLAFIFAAFISFIAIMAAQYITWMPLESPGLGGVQSRYFTPVLLFLVFGIAGFSQDQVLKNWQVPIFILVVVFPLISQVVMVHSLIARYYLN